MHDRAIWNNFERLYIDYQPRLIAYALRFVGDSVEAQDLVQDCFVRLWDDYAELEEDEAPMLLFTMMRHRCLNFLKHKRIVREYADRQISRIRPDRRGEERLYNLCFSYNEAEYPYLYQELEREIQRITDSLPQRCREVFILSRFQGMKNREIAERLHISLQAVEKHIQKALRIFSEMLGRENSLYTILILLWMMNAARSPNSVRSRRVHACFGRRSESSFHFFQVAVGSRGGLPYRACAPRIPTCFRQKISQLLSGGESSDSGFFP